MTRLTPQQKAMAAAQQAHSAYQARLAEQELQARKEPIKAIATSYNVELGEWEAATPDGGTIRAKSLSNANIKGRSLPVQRFSGSQEAAINEAPTSADFGQVYSDVEQLGQQLVSLLQTQLGTDSPNTLSVAPGNALYLEDDKGALWYWDSSLATPAWVCFSQLYQNFTGVPSVDVRIDGAIAINDAETIYTGTVSGGWTELSTGGGGSFDGVVLKNSALNLSVPYGFDANTSVSFAGWTEQVDTGIYWASGTPTRIVLGVGTFRVNFSAIVERYADEDALTYWRVECLLVDQSDGTTIVDQAHANTSLSIFSTSGDVFLAPPNRVQELKLQLSDVLVNATAGNWLEFYVAQYGESEGLSGKEFSANLSLGNSLPASVVVEKLA